MDRAEITSRIQSGINDPDGAFFSPDQVHAAIDEAAEVIAEESGAVKRSAFLALQPGTAYHYLSTIAPDIMAVYRIWNQTALKVHRRLTPCTFEELDRLHRTWQGVSGVNIPEYWYPVSWDVFGIFPKISAGGGVLRVDYLAWPRALMDDDDEPEFQLGDHDLFVVYGVYEGLAKRWDAPRMLEAWSEFARRVGISRARTGQRTAQARYGQQPLSEGGSGFTTGVRLP